MLAHTCFPRLKIAREVKKKSIIRGQNTVLRITLFVVVANVFVAVHEAIVAIIRSALAQEFIRKKSEKERERRE